MPADAARTSDLALPDETLEVLGNPALVAQIRNGLAEYARGDVEVLSKEEILATLRP